MYFRPRIPLYPVPVLSASMVKGSKYIWLKKFESKFYFKKHILWIFLQCTVFWQYNLGPPKILHLYIVSITLKGDRNKNQIFSSVGNFNP